MNAIRLAQPLFSKTEADYFGSLSEEEQKSTLIFFKVLLTYSNLASEDALNTLTQLYEQNLYRKDTSEAWQPTFTLLEGFLQNSIEYQPLLLRKVNFILRRLDKINLQFDRSSDEAKLS